MKNIGGFRELHQGIGLITLVRKRWQCFIVYHNVQDWDKFNIASLNDLCGIMVCG